MPLVQRTFARIAYTSRIPFKFPSGSLSVRITRPDNTVDDLIMTAPTGGVTRGLMYAIQNIHVVARETKAVALDAGRTGIWDWNLVTGEVHLDARVRALWAA